MTSRSNNPAPANSSLAGITDSSVVGDSVTTMVGGLASEANLDTKVASLRSLAVDNKRSRPAGPSLAEPHSTPGQGEPTTHTRYDAINGRWTIFASGRGERPSDYVDLPAGTDLQVQCPFCAGNEQQTPASVLEISAGQCDALSLDVPPGNGDADKWAIRVVPNKYPAVDLMTMSQPNETDLPRWARRGESSALFRSRPVSGGHEVFVESGGHQDSLVSLDLNHVTMLFRAYQLRMQYWRQQPLIQFISVFKNSGSSAGASLHHSHSQLIATSELPVAPKAIADRMKLHWARTGCCLRCELVRAELKAKTRIVTASESMVAYCPFASHLPMLMQITSRRHLNCFEQLTITELGQLARLVRASIRWLLAIYPEVSYNFVIHTRPPAIIGEEAGHWAFEIFPRITHLAGFEWGSDCLINPILPEDAARLYRQAAMQENPLR